MATLPLSLAPGLEPLPTALSTQAETGTPTDPAGAAQPQPPGGNFLIPLLLIGAIFYFVLILPEKKKQKQRQALLDGIKKGDQVMTASGLFAQVVQVQDEVITLQAAEGVRLRFNRGAVQSVIDPNEKVE